MHSIITIKNRFVWHRTGKYTVCRDVCALFSPGNSLKTSMRGGSKPEYLAKKHDSQHKNQYQIMHIRGEN